MFMVNMTPAAPCLVLQMREPKRHPYEASHPVNPLKRRDNKDDQDEDEDEDTEVGKAATNPRFHILCLLPQTNRNESHVRLCAEMKNECEIQVYFDKLRHCKIISCGKCEPRLEDGLDSNSPVPLKSRE